MTARDDYWSALTEAFLTWTGMQLPPTMRQSAIALLEQRATHHQCSVADYLQQTESDRDMRQELLDEIGLGTTWFMRDEPGLRTLIRALTRANSARDRTVWLWSAGCSSGEEAYSLSMALADEGLQSRVLGTDLNRFALERAKRAVYSKRSLRHVPKAWFWRHFDRVGDDEYQVKQEIRRNVSFELHNLTSGRYPPTGWFRFDAIVCRNVLLYFEQDMALQIMASMANACRPNGYLLLGAIERPILWMSALVDRDQAAELVQVMPGTTENQPRFSPVVDLRKHLPHSYFAGRDFLDYQATLEQVASGELDIVAATRRMPELRRIAGACPCSKSVRWVKEDPIAAAASDAETVHGG